MGYINDLDAMRRSSNVYMAEIAMRLAEVNRSTNQWPRLGEAHNDLRQHYAQFGLGTETGIDLPRESSGLIGTSNSGLLLYLSFGQFDTYTPLQLGQFSATMLAAVNGCARASFVMCLSRVWKTEQQVGASALCARSHEHGQQYECRFSENARRNASSRCRIRTNRWYGL